MTWKVGLSNDLNITCTVTIVGVGGLITLDNNLKQES